MISTDGFMPGPRIELPPQGAGPLSGLTFAAKDLFQVKGRTAGFGNPDWLRTHAPAGETAPLIGKLLANGARLEGKTITDEMAYSLVGDNAHYGAPLNAAAQERFTGGSSSGSAAVVAAGSVDFALGTDTAGSIRIPASHCGLFGFRPTHGALSTHGVLPLAPSFDVPGWLARDADVFVTVGRALFDDAPLSCPSGLRVAIVRGAFDRVTGPCRESLWSVARGVATQLRAASAVVLDQTLPLTELADCFRVLQSDEAWRQHGEWITSCRPTLNLDIRARFEWGASQDAAAVRTAENDAVRHREWIEALFGAVDILVWPTAAEPALVRTSSPSERGAYRRAILQLTSLASLAGLPEATLPVCRIGGLPMGVSLIAPRGCDVQLLNLIAMLPATSAYDAGS